MCEAVFFLLPQLCDTEASKRSKRIKMKYLIILVSVLLLLAPVALARDGAET